MSHGTNPGLRGNLFAAAAMGQTEGLAATIKGHDGRLRKGAGGGNIL
jgi:hypothetical protein